MSASTAPGTVVAQLVETMTALAGSHPGFRAAHAKGIVCSGTFRASPDARRVTRAPYLQGQTIPTVIRFSNANGNPDVHDGLPGTRALSVKFQLPDDERGRALERIGDAPRSQDTVSVISVSAPRGGSSPTCSTATARGTAGRGEALSDACPTEDEGTRP